MANISKLMSFDHEAILFKIKFKELFCVLQLFVFEPLRTIFFTICIFTIKNAFLPNLDIYGKIFSLAVD